MPYRLVRRMIASGLILAASTSVSAQTPRDTVTVDRDGTIHADRLVVPLSDMLSPEARTQIAARLQQHFPAATGGDAIANARKATDAFLAPLLARWEAIYPSTITRVVMNGVRTDVVVPKAGIAKENAARILINLHGGGFFAGSGIGGRLEAVPLAGRGRIKVVAVDYRLAPEAHFPAASEDVAYVYRALLKDYRPENIGIYGCSAGGTLVAQAVAWFQQHGLPRPGAIGIFCSGAMPSFWYGGDALSVAPMLNGQPAPTPEQLKTGAGNLYLAGVDGNDPLVTPGLFPKTLALFPPTLLVTSTRDSAMSNALVTNVKLLEVGVETQLFVQEGTGHGEFTTIPGTPEAMQAYDLIWTFFDRHLAR
ncbi:alpha/beta hydrolase [Sphingomonas sp. 4RDLI-65]|uniref:alpha/beta hydrolase n=1 Tax=Sphingomonas sp. 4RDLI-65 TaxID=3111641 RepID=UPI003C239ACF